MEASNEGYQYEHLPTTTSIRLLKVLKAGDGRIPRVLLKIVDLADKPVYSALSYTWGNPHANGVDFSEHFNTVNGEYSASQKTPVLCDGKTLDVQRNLLDVLDELDHRSAGSQSQGLNLENPEISPNSLGLPEDGVFYLWIDAVCINQNDMAERAHQVTIMDRIYEQAIHTIIWLGRADQYTQAAAATIVRVAAYPKESFLKSEVIPFRRQDMAVYAGSNLPYTGWMDWCSLAALLKRQWFSRLWIVQETVLSRSLVLLCGKFEIAWADLATAARNIEARCAELGWSASTIFLQTHEIAVPLEHNVVRLANWRDYYHDKTATEMGRFTLEDLVYDTWVFHSSDPRDKVYGILGLLEPELRARWVVDYHSAPEEAYAVMARRVIEHSRSLKILSCVQDVSTRRISAYPSWVPDFSLPYFNMMCNHGQFAAAGRQHRTPQILPSPFWSRLRLRAHVFDTVVETANDRTDYVNSSMLLEPSWFELALLLKTPYQATGQKRTEVLWRTLCANQDAASSAPEAPASFAALFKELLCAMVMVRAELEAEETSIPREQPGNPPPPRDCAASFADAMQRARGIWADVGWDGLGAAEIYEKTNSRPRLLWKPEFGWLVHTLIKIQALAVTEAAGEQCADVPSWAELEAFHEDPSYVMRVQDGQERKLVMPNNAAFMNAFRRKYVKRKLFYTEKGYLGLGPASTTVGDLVCILPGAAGPFVLREDADGGIVEMEDNPEQDVKGLRLVGESYVHGIMHGEAAEEDGFILEEIELV